MNTNEDEKKVKKLMIGYQRAEETATTLYSHIAKKIKDEKNKKILMQIAAEEKDHAGVWKRYTGEDVGPNYFKVFWYKIVAFLMGYTFVIKLLEKDEYTGINNLKLLKREIPEVDAIVQQERAHEETLINMLDEERLQYVGSMVLGLNDALVELTGTIAGLTFALANTKLVALAGIVTGVSATLSMAASNYLAERADDNPRALEASFYTGIAYLITVVLLVLPYLVYPDSMYDMALITMLVIVFLIILFFNYYISVAKSVPFFPRFKEMACISLTVALISFLIGLLVKNFLGIDI